MTGDDARLAWFFFERAEALDEAGRESRSSLRRLGPTSQALR